MVFLLGVDTGGTYTDAVLMDADMTRIVAKAKSPTTHPDLAGGIGAAIDAVIAQARVAPGDIGLVSLSTTLATNALVEGRGGRVALVFAGFDPGDLDRDGLAQALGGDPVIHLDGGHDHAGTELAPLDLHALDAALRDLPSGITGLAVAARFATRNPAHEIAIRDRIRDRTGRPVTCSHELSSGLGGPKRALTAVLNARLIGMIANLVDACEGHLSRRGIAAPLMVVRGDGALIPATLARARPIETILSGPAASAVGAGWLTNEGDALVSDIGGTTTDVCILRGGMPRIDPDGARVGGHRTMVEAVAMRTTGLGGDSAVTLAEGLPVRLTLGPRRVLPVAVLAARAGAMVHAAFDRWLSRDTPGEGDGRFALPLVTRAPDGLDRREAEVMDRLLAGPAPRDAIVSTRLESSALDRLVARGHALEAGVTPTDAVHVAGLVSTGDVTAARAALALFARRRTARGDRIASDAAAAAALVLDALTDRTVACLLEAAFAEDGWTGAPETLARHPLTRAGLDGRRGALRHDVALDVPLIGLGASAARLYGPVGARLRTMTLLPPDGDVANAIGAVAGQVAMTARGTMTRSASGDYILHLPDGRLRMSDRDAAEAALETALGRHARDAAMAAGVPDPQVVVSREVDAVDIDGLQVFVEARIEATARGRPRLASAR